MSEKGEERLSAVEFEEGANAAEGYGSGGFCGGVFGLSGWWQGLGYKHAARPVSNLQTGFRCMGGAGLTWNI